MKPFKLPLLGLLATTLLVSAPIASAFPRTKEKATVTISFTLAPPEGSVSTATGSASLDVTKLNGVSTASDLKLTISGLTTGTYTVAAVQKSDGASVTIAAVAFDSTVTPDPAAPGLPLPPGLDPFDIAKLTISDATPVVVLEGAAVESIARWIYSANVAITAPPGAVPIPPVHGHGKAKKVHGHVLVHSLIVDDVEKRRKFLLVAFGAPADTVLTVNLDGVAVGTVTSTPRGKVMLKSLDGDFRLAGTGELTITDAVGTVIMQADFFPGID